jgi:hypothetical protein
LDSLEQEELMLYVFLILAADRNGLSYYSGDRICSILHMALEKYIAAIDGLIKNDLIAFDGTLFQVLSLPPGPRQRPKKKTGQPLTGYGTSAAIGPLFKGT